jgi:SPOR domain
LYRAISGKRPIEATARQLRDDLIPVEELGKDGYRQQFLGAIDWALILRPEDRPQSIAQWRRALFGVDVTADDQNGTIDAVKAKQEFLAKFMRSHGVPPPVPQTGSGEIAHTGRDEDKTPEEHSVLLDEKQTIKPSPEDLAKQLPSNAGRRVLPVTIVALALAGCFLVAVGYLVGRKSSDLEGTAAEKGQRQAITLEAKRLTLNLADAEGRVVEAKTLLTAAATQNKELREALARAQTDAQRARAKVLEMEEKAAKDREEARTSLNVAVAKSKSLQEALTKAESEIKRLTATLLEAAKDRQQNKRDYPVAFDGTGGYVTVISSQRVQADAFRITGEMREKYQSVLGKLVLEVQEANLGDKGIWFRVIVSPKRSRDAANQICEQLKTAGNREDCWITSAQ